MNKKSIPVTINSFSIGDIGPLKRTHALKLLNTLTSDWYESSGIISMIR